MSIRVGIMGYGNIGRGVEAAIERCDDMELKAVFTRRDPASLKIRNQSAMILKAEDAAEYADQIDVLINCGGSATDLPKQTPACAALFNVVDSFDNHAHIPEHFAAVDEAARKAGKAALISCGWDPGLFSLARIYSASIVPDGRHYTFWGRGVSQGHSDAVRRIPGVKDARQYTVPVEASLEKVRAGENPELTTRMMHTRECFIVAEEGADLAAIEQAVKTMPNYFADYDTTVYFIDEETMKREHSALPHGGFVLRSAEIGWPEEGNKALVEFSLKLDSNAEFTASVLVAYARAVARLAAEGKCGALSVFDIAPAYLSPLSGDELRAHLL